MENVTALNRNLSTIGWGTLLVWWGVAIAVGPITIGMTAIGTGMILLGVNAARSLKGIPVRYSTVPVAVVAIVWGGLDTAFNLSFAHSVALMLMAIGVVVIASLLTHPETA